MSAYMLGVLVVCRPVAYLPSVSDPPAPATLWHIAQLMRNSSAPWATSPSPSSTSSSGKVGPGEVDCTYSAIAAIWSSVNCTGFCGACGACACSGILPVDTWQCTDSSPTRSEEHTSELQSLMRSSYAVF